MGIQELTFKVDRHSFDANPILLYFYEVNNNLPILSEFNRPAARPLKAFKAF
jgi:hypothetical protein